MVVEVTEAGTEPAPVGDPTLYPFERQAITGLALASLPNEDEVRVQLLGSNHLYPSLHESLEHLTELTSLGARLGHRTLGLRLLAKVASRRGMEPLEREAGTVRTYLRATLDQTDAELGLLKDHHHERAAMSDATQRVLTSRSGGASIRDESPDVQAMLDGLERAAQRRLPSWGSFAPEAATPLKLSDEELAIPRCSDQEGVLIDGHRSVRIATWFSSDKPAKAFAPWTDPRTWPVACSLFFESITTDDDIPETAECWSATFLERVVVSNDKSLETPLTFTRTVIGEDLYALYFTIPPRGETQDLLVDTGSLIVRQDPCHPSGARTQLFSEKCLRFRDPALRAWPTLLCDLYWMELAMLTALGCRHE